MANATTKLSVNATCRTFPNQLFFFFNDTATTEIYTLSLHDALPILSRRPLMGMVQALLRPGTLRASSMRRTSSSVEIVSGVKWRKTDLAVSGAHEEYQVGTRRHSERGLRMTSVSSMDSGAGSVEVSARPAFPSTWSTSGNRLSMPCARKGRDRKSTRLNSSHSQISYAVFCLK